MTILDDDLKEIFGRVIGFWRLRNSNILITGSAGFLGYYYSNFLLRYSRELEIESITLADIKNPSSRIDVEYDTSIVNFLEMDMSQGTTNKSNKNFFDVIINLASFASPVAYRADPIATVRGSVLSVWNLLENYCDDIDQNGSFQIFSSSEIYGDPPGNEIPTSEDYRGNVSCLGPRACYDESKRFIETLGSVYAKQNGANISVIRPFNNFGPGMSLHDGRLPADVMRAMIKQEKLALFSDGTPTRSFCYVADAIVGYLLALNNTGFRVYNIGNDTEELSVRAFVERSADVYKGLTSQCFDFEFTKSEELDYLTDNPNRRFPNLSKARNELLYSPQISLEEGINRWLTFEMEKQGA